MAPRVAVCVGVTRSDVIGDLVDSLLAQTIDDWQAVLVCQRGAIYACDDPRVTVIESARLGRSAALNEARAAATAPVLAFTDDDCIADADWLETGLRYLDASPDVALLGGSTLAPERTARFSACPMVIGVEATYNLERDGDRLPPGFQIPGANAFVPAVVFDELGGFDEALGAGTVHPAAEDLDFGVRAKHAGMTLASTPTLINHHTHGERTGLRNVIRHHRGYAKGSGAFTAKWAKTGLEPGMNLRPTIQGASLKTRIIYLVTYPSRVAGYRSYRSCHPPRPAAELIRQR